MAGKAISLEQFKEALKAIRNSTISEPDLSVKFVENASNWNAAEGEPGYIQGRTHWTELGMVDIFKDLEVSELEDGAGQGMLPGTYDIEAGKQYIVTYNGTEFRCTSAYFGEEGVNMAVVIGNVDALTGTGDSGEPFLLMFVLPEFIEAVGVASAIMFLDGSSSAVISLSGEAEIVHKLPQKYYDAADWEAYTREKGHVLNKPFGNDGETILEETSVTLENLQPIGQTGQKITLSQPIIDGQRYQININEEKFFSTAHGDGASTALGNFSIFGMVNYNTLEPFFIQMYGVSTEATLIMKDYMPGDTITIQIKTANLKQLDPVYIANDVARPYFLDLSYAILADGSTLEEITQGVYTRTILFDELFGERSFAEGVKAYEAILRSGLIIAFKTNADIISVKLSSISFIHQVPNGERPTLNNIIDTFTMQGYDGATPIQAEIHSAEQYGTRWVQSIRVLYGEPAT